MTTYRLVLSMYPEGEPEIPLCTSDLTAIMADSHDEAAATFIIIRQGFGLKVADIVTAIEDDKGRDEEPDIKF